MDAKQIIDALKAYGLRETDVHYSLIRSGHEVTQGTLNKIARGITKNPKQSTLLALQQLYASMLLVDKSKSRAA